MEVSISCSDRQQNLQTTQENCIENEKNLKMYFAFRNSPHDIWREFMICVFVVIDYNTNQEIFLCNVQTEDFFIHFQFIDLTISIRSTPFQQTSFTGIVDQLKFYSVKADKGPLEMLKCVCLMFWDWAKQKNITEKNCSDCTHWNAVEIVADNLLIVFFISVNWTLFHRSAMKLQTTLVSISSQSPHLHHHLLPGVGPHPAGPGRVQVLLLPAADPPLPPVEAGEAVRTVRVYWPHRLQCQAGTSENNPDFN